MKKSLAIGLALVVLGALVFAAAFAAGGWDITALSTRPERTERVYETAAEVTHLAIQERDGNVRVEPSPDGQTHIVYYESDVETYEIHEQDGALEILYRDRRKFYERIFDINFQRVTMLVQLPESFAGEMILNTDNGTVEVESVVAGRTEIQADNGSIRLKALSTASLRLDADNGKIIAENLVVEGDFDARASNGKIELQGLAAAGDATCVSNNGSLTVRNASSASARFSLDNGSVRLENLSVADGMEAEADNGAIYLEGVTFGASCSLTASNGKIQGTLSGKTIDYTIESRADNGKNTLPENLKGGDKRLTVIAKNGSIDLSFAGDEN